VAAESLRLFVALWPGAAVRAALGARRDAIAWPPGAAPVADARLHLTLHFLGDVPAARLPELMPALWVPFRPFQLHVGGTVAWPRGLVVAPLAAPDALSALHGTLTEALTRLAMPLEARTLRPHVTLARRAAGARWPTASAPIVWRVNGYALVWSDRGSYRVLARYTPRGLSRRRAAPKPTESPRGGQ
jgi:2'-5' RNA ligase